MLHLVSGQGAAHTVAELGLDGRCLVWSEALATGPVAAIPYGEAFYALRAGFLGADTNGFVLQHRQLIDALDGGEEIVLWFGRDVFCQIILAAVARTIADTGTANVSVSLVLPGGEAPGCLVGGTEEYALWFSHRVRLSAEELQAMAQMWDRYSDPDPRQLMAPFTSTSTAVTQMLGALSVHASRFPDPAGLGCDERDILELVASGVTNFTVLFSGFCQRRGDLGWGDVQVQAIIDTLARLPDPAISRDGKEIAITERGRQALAGQRDLREGGNDRMRTLGGVSLGPGEIEWRWDGQHIAGPALQ